MCWWQYSCKERVRETRRQIERGWSLADCPPSGAGGRMKGASREDALSPLVTVWPALGYLSLLAHVTHTNTHFPLCLTSTFLSDHSQPPTSDPTRTESERRPDTRLFLICKNSGQLPKQTGRDADETAVGVDQIVNTVRVWLQSKEKILFGFFGTCTACLCCL